MSEEKHSTRLGRSLLPTRVGDAEWAYVQARRDTVHVEPSAPLLGVCLSGGGIRSATFNLGVLQGLSASPVLRHSDYLSTVSGGGFIGGCLTSLVRHVELDGSTRLDGAVTPKAKPGETSLDAQQMPLNRYAPLSHLRRHAQYLVTRRSPFSAEMLRLVGTILSGLLFTVLLGVMLLLVVVSLYLFLVNLIAGDVFIAELFAPKENFPGWGHLPKAFVVNGGPAAQLMALHSDAYAFLGMGALGGALGVLATYLRRWPHRWPNLKAELKAATGGLTSQQHAQYRHVMGYALSLAIAWLVVFAALHLFEDDGSTLHSQMGQARAFRSDSWLLGPALLSIGAGASVALMHPFLSRTRRWGRSLRTVYYGMHGVNLALLVVGLLFSGCTMLMWWVHESEGTMLAVMLVSVAGVWVGSIRRRNGREDREIGAVDRIFEGIKILCAALFAIVGFAFVTDFVAEHLGSASLMADGPFGWLTVTLGALIIAALIGLAVDFNKVSLNNFYMDRLAESYLATTRKIDGKLHTVRDDGDLELHHLQGIPGEGADPKTGPALAPLHLIVGAINLAGTNDLARQADKSEPFVFSSLYCGSSSTGYVRTQDYRGGATTLAEAISISGAAVTSAMGSYTTPALAFGLTLLNLRMGQWLLNPSYYGDKVVHTRSEDSGTFRMSREFMVRPSRAERWVFWARYLFAEMRSHTTAQTPLVSVSDGGHTGDNCGLVPLLMRRCKVILCSDASYDPRHACGDFATGIRQILVEENSAVDIDVVPLQPDEAGRVGLPYAIGRVQYGQTPAPGPESDSQWERHVSTSEEGWIIYMKLALAGDEPAAVSSYRVENPRFPHDPTSAQFFRDEQLEAYRVLGLVNTKRLLAELGEHADSTELLATWCEAQWNAARARRRQRAHLDRELDASVQ